MTLLHTNSYPCGPSVLSCFIDQHKNKRSAHTHARERESTYSKSLTEPLKANMYHIAPSGKFVFVAHDDIIKWKHFPRYWPFVQGIHRSPVNSPHKGQWRGALMFSLICVWINEWVNNREAGDLRRYRAHYDVTLMMCHGPLHGRTSTGLINGCVSLQINQYKSHPWSFRGGDRTRVAVFENQTKTKNLFTLCSQ